jgi:hypothetical protein
MKLILSFLLMFSSLFTQAELIYLPATAIINSSPKEQSVLGMQENLSLEHFMSMDRSTFEAHSGKKMTIYQRYKFKQLKDKIKRNPELFNTHELAKLTDTDNRKIHWSSIASIIFAGAVVLSLLAPAFAIIPAVPAVIFGFMGMKKSGTNKEYKGRGLAVTGLLIGAAGVLTYVSIYLIGLIFGV